MARPLRIEYEGAWYHVMNRGLEHRSIFLTDKHRQCFLDMLLDIHKRYQTEIHAYCLMDNHYHLIIRTPLGNLSRIMRHLDGVYTQHFNRDVKRDGPLFRGRYKAILFEADQYLLQLSRYVHMNPVKAKLVRHPEHFKWSSYQSYLSGNNQSWLYLDTTLSYFNGAQKINMYKSFVEAEVDKDTSDSNEKLKCTTIWGSEQFQKIVADNYLNAKHKIDDIPERKFLTNAATASLGEIISRVTLFYDMHFGLKRNQKKSDNIFSCHNRTIRIVSNC